MKDLLTSMIDRSSDNGLLLFDAPTGLGKTTAAVNFIHNFLSNRKSSPTRILYVTNLKKNLPDEELQFLLDDQYKDSVLFLKPYAEILIENWNRANINNKQILDTKQYKELKLDIEQLNEKQNSEIKTNSRFIENLFKKISEKSEPEFRRTIKKLLLTNVSQLERKKILKEFSWISELYPTVELEKYKILLMSTDKFFSPIDPFYRLPFYFYNDEIIKNAIIFIDEFDSTKKILINHIIEDGIKLNIDIIALFTSIFHVLKNTSFPKIIFKTTKAYEENKRKDSKENHIRSIIDKNIEHFSLVYEKYHMNSLFKSDENDRDKAFLFSDGNTIEIIKNKSKKRLFILFDEDTSVNRVTSEKVYHNSFNLKDAILEIKKAIDYFINGVNMIAQNYQSVKNESKKADYFTIEEAIDSVVSIFNINDDMRDFVVASLKNIHTNGQLVIKTEPKFIDNGYMFLEVEDSNYHDFQSRIRLYQFSTTPESIITNLSMIALVVGMSATASLKTIIGNYDIDYLKKRLQSNLVTFNESELSILKNLFCETQKEYYNNQVKVNAIIVDDTNSLTYTNAIKDLVTFLTGDENYFSKLEIVDTNIYQILNLLKLAKVYVQFAKESEQKSIICFLNALPGYNKDFDLDLLNRIINDAVAYHKVDQYKKVVVNSVDYDVQLEEIHQSLYEGDKVMMITTYQTIGTGKNIQFELKDSMNESVIYDLNAQKREKDFDAIYLQTPSNLVQHLRDNSDEPYEDLARFLFHQEYLYRNKSIEFYQLKKNIENGFRKTFFSDKYLKISNKNKDLPFHTAQIIIQAVGRICRSRIQNRLTTVYVDKEVVLRVQDIRDELTERLLSYKFNSILDIKYNNNFDQLIDFSIKNKECSQKINSSAYSLRISEKFKSSWIRLRDFVLKNPTADFIPEEFKDYYYEFDQKVSYYTYKLDNNGNLTRLLIDTKYDYHEVSEMESGLSYFMEIDNLREHFNQEKYATEFKKAKYIMLPSFYKQIYKGALGEIIGKYVVESEILGDNLQEIDDLNEFELFDYKYNGVYIDFKHWQNYDGNDLEMKQKILKKLEKTAGKKVLVINILKRGNHEFKLTNDNIIHKIPYLYDHESDGICDEVHDAILNCLL